MTSASFTDRIRLDAGAVLFFVRLFALRFEEGHCARSATSLAFTSLLSLVPFVTVALIVTSFFPGFAELAGTIKAFLLDNLLPERAGSIIAQYALEFSEKAAGLTVLGTAGLFVTSVMMLLTIDETFNHIWGVRRARPWLTRLTTYWAVLTIGPLLMAGSILAASHVIRLSMDVTANLSWLREMLLRMIPLGLLSALFSLLYHAIPNTRVAFKHALVGGILAALIFTLMQRLMGYYLVRFPSYTLVYGTFAALPIFLMWLYLSWVIVLSGAIVTALLPEFLGRHRFQKPYPGHVAQAALRLLCPLCHVMQKGTSLDAESLSASARLPLVETEALLDRLEKQQWVKRTDMGEWVLSRNPHTLRIVDLIRIHALDTRTWLESERQEGLDSSPELLRALDVLIAQDTSTLADFYRQVEKAGRIKEDKTNA
jgi:membrane protein